MIPNHIIEYLESHGVPYRRRTHSQAVSGDELAHALHVSGYRVAKSVVVDCEGRMYLAVLPAADRVDLVRLGAILRGPVELVAERQFAPLFVGCEPGAEPPLGRLYGLPVVMDSSLLTQDRLVLRAGTHRECLELATLDYVDLEHPQVGGFAILPVWTEARRGRELRA